MFLFFYMATATQIEQSIKDNPYFPYAMKLVEAAGLDLFFPEEEQEEYIEELIEQIALRVGIVVRGKLSPEDYEEYLDMVDLASAGDAQAVSAIQPFLEDHIENWQQLFQDTLKAFGEEYVASANSLKV